MITLFGEIAPQAYFSRNAFADDRAILPFLTFSRAALFFLARPTAILLDWWLGVEGITYLHERDVRSLVGRAAANGGDIGKLEATGVQNFLDLDDLPVTEDGDIISLPLAPLGTPDEDQVVVDNIVVRPLLHNLQTPRQRREATCRVRQKLFADFCGAEC